MLLNFYTFGVPPRYSGLVITCYTPNASKHSVVTSFKTNLLSIHALNTPLVLLTFYIFGVSQHSVVTSIETNLLRITVLKPYYLTSLPSTVKLCFETSVILKVQWTPSLYIPDTKGLLPLRKHFPKASSTCEALSTLNVDPFIMKRGIKKSKFSDLIFYDYRISLFITF